MIKTTITKTKTTRAKPVYPKLIVEQKINHRANQESTPIKIHL
jgi:hypothetical protein